MTRWNERLSSYGSPVGISAIATALGPVMAARSDLQRRLHAARLELYKRQGLQIGENFFYAGVPNFGGEPYMISIGNNVSIASRVQFITHDGMAWHLRKLGELEKGIGYGRITVHDDCGIGFGAIILPGVSIGPRSMVGAGAVVGRDVRPGVVVSGNPARVAMQVDDLVTLFRRNDPDFDDEAYRLDRKTEVLRVFPPHS